MPQVVLGNVRHCGRLLEQTCGTLRVCFMLARSRRTSLPSGEDHAPDWLDFYLPIGALSRTGLFSRWPAGDVEWLSWRRPIGECFATCQAVLALWREGNRSRAEQQPSDETAM